MGGARSTYGGEEEYIQGCWLGKLRERDHFEDPGVDRRIILRWFIRKCDAGTWTGLIWLRIGRDGGHLQMR